MATVPGYYTMDEAADVLKVSVSQISRYISAGRMPAIDLGRQKLIEQHVVHTFEKPPIGNPQFRERAKKS